MDQMLGSVVSRIKDLCGVASIKGVCVINSTTGEPHEFLGPNPMASSFTLRFYEEKCDS